MIPPAAFFTVHSQLPREGPGCDADVAWACAAAHVKADARILDAGCGPGADIAALLMHAPEGHVLGVEKHAPFIEQARRLHGHDARVTLEIGDMADVDGSFDFIWCAGALYFLGIEAGLQTLGDSLAPGGAIAFSHLVYTVDTPEPELQRALALEMPDVAGIAVLKGRIEEAGFTVLDQRVLPDVSWAAYYDPMRARLARLQNAAEEDDDLRAAIDEHTAEIALYDRFGTEFGYVLSVVQPT
jgi:SAM-dependent methyltransferase